MLVLIQRAIPIRILTVGKKRSQGVQLIVDEYMKKLRHYCSVDDVRIKSNPKNARYVEMLSFFLVYFNWKLVKICELWSLFNTK